MFIFLKKWHQGGFTLPEIMVGGAIIAGVGLAGATLFSNQNKEQNRIEQMKQLVQYHAVIEKHLQNNLNCNATLKTSLNTTSIGGGTLPGILSCNGTCVPGTDPAALGTQSFRAVGNYIDSTSSGATANSKSVWLLSQINMANTLSQTGTLRLVLNYTLNPRLGNFSFNKDVNLTVRFGEDGFSKECVNNQESSINNLQKDLCTSLTSINSSGEIVARWDDSLQRCVLVNNLKNCTSSGGLMVEGIRSDGSVHCRAMKDGFDANNVVNPAVTTCDAGKVGQLVKVGTRLVFQCL